MKIYMLKTKDIDIIKSYISFKFSDSFLVVHSDPFLTGRLLNNILQLIPPNAL